MEASSRKSLFIIIIIMKRIFEELNCSLYVCLSLNDNDNPHRMTVNDSHCDSLSHSTISTVIEEIFLPDPPKFESI